VLGFGFGLGFGLRWFGLGLEAMADQRRASSFSVRRTALKRESRKAECDATLG
jgi:hypothetical protein